MSHSDIFALPLWDMKILTNKNKIIQERANYFARVIEDIEQENCFHEVNVNI